jgi:diguanylate cyclase (GGDEF)-like protein/PAS domain S-box-containing protein
MKKRCINILLIQNNLADLSLVQQWLSESGMHPFNLVHTTSCAAGLVRLSQGDINLILLDLSLPDGGDLDALTSLHHVTPDVPIVLLTDRDEDHLAIRAVQEGAQDVIIKQQISGPLLGRALRYAVERMRAQKALNESEARYRSLFNRIPVALYCTLPDGEIQDANPALVELLGYPDRESLMHANASVLFMDPGQRLCEREILEKEGIVLGFKLQLRRYDGTPIWVRDTVRKISSASGARLYYEGSLEDITDQEKSQERLNYMATHDSLTNLPNRVLLHDRLSQALERAVRSNGHSPHSMVAVMLLDLDHFKQINDTRGHSVGDLVLQAAADRLKGCVRASDTVARMGGDEFSMVLPDLANHRDGSVVAQKVLDSIARPFLLDGYQYSISASIGISLYPIDGKDVETLLRYADIAMYNAKEMRNCYQFFSEGIVA